MFASSSSGKSVFSTNVSITGGGSLPTSDSKHARTFTALKRLVKYVDTISIIFKEYKKGNFVTVGNILTQKVYNRYAIELNNLRENRQKFREYETMRVNCIDSLHGMYQAVQQQAIKVDLEHALENAREAEEILEDPKRLQRYIDKLNRQVAVFPDANVTIMAATLKPEYNEYIRIYGYPEGGVFDMDLLAEILKKQQPNFL